MWQYVVRRLLYNVPVFLGIILLVMLALRVRDPEHIYVGKHATAEELQQFREKAGLDKDFPFQYRDFLFGNAAEERSPFGFGNESWDKPGKEVGELLRAAVGPTLAITLPAMVLTAVISIVIGLVSAFHRGRLLDRTLMTLAVLGMSVSFLVYILLGQYFGSFKPAVAWNWNVFAVQGFDTSHAAWWFYYCLLPVLISTIVAMGYDTRYYRAVMVEESGKDYIRTARAKGVKESRVMFKHMLKNASISIITRIMITFPFLITGSILLEVYFNIPGMGKMLITAINAADFPVIQSFTAVFAVLFILSNILTDVLYAVADPRVRLS
ncbi:MAG: ABC transporter permease [Planctomycetota bacterium]|jgi:peptide/nickel transport system permease protein